ncbi:hypothetical protein AcW1_009026 [Taiwanofungus camphoratus]|nr:hypothetical protein AcW1_009026 [Antrodia cinnamomea]
MLAIKNWSVSASRNSLTRARIVMASLSTSSDPQSLAGTGPMEKSIKEKLISLLQPLELTISNDSWQHRHHAAMRAQGGGSGETRMAYPLDDMFPSTRH